MIKDLKNPVSWMSWGGDMRLRNEYFDNAQSLTSDPKVDKPFGALHSQDQFRVRGRLWTSIAPVEALSLNARLSAEPRTWMEPSSTTSYFGAAGRSGTSWRYGILDNLFVNWTNVAGLPVQLKVGRQDLAFIGKDMYYGVGPKDSVWFDADTPPWTGPWLVADATPNDGSWSFFFDSARLRVNLEEQKTTIDAIGILQYAKPDEWLPTLGPSTRSLPNNYYLTDQNEKGAILWINNKSVPWANLDGYFIYKHDTRINNLIDGIPGTTPRFGDDADIYTVGGRLSGAIQEHWRYSAEGAYQFGEKRDPGLNKAGANGLLPASAQTTDFRDINAFGVNSQLTYDFKDKLKNKVFFAYEFLSGDDPNTKGDEMFDVLWGRYPRWSELYNVYSYIAESRVGQTGNLHRFGPGWSINPTEKLNFNLNYNLMFADQDVPTRAIVPTAFSQNDNFRGHYLQAILKYKFSKHMSGHLWSEFVFPGHFYTDVGQPMMFLRAELMFTL
jgi:hypothetical protein